MGRALVVGGASLAIGGAMAFSQVVVTSTNRVWSTNACVHAPPNNPNWCEQYGGSDTSTASYSDGHSTGIGSSAGVHGDEGFADAICAASQSSSFTNTHFDIACSVRSDIDSAGIGSSGCVASTYVAIRFSVSSPQVFTLYLQGTTLTAPIETTLGVANGATLFSSQGSHDGVKRTLQPGSYEYITRGTADGNCSGPCAHKEQSDWSAQVYFEDAPCPADLNGDSMVEDADFVIFVAAYNDLLCPDAPDACPCDLNGDGLVDDADFVYFVGAYNDLICS
ncbi:MAG: hypothetical protein U0570_10455 [Phycisphaerales bacterium]